MFFFFFFKQKTAYEIYQCDWSSDVCSSDLDLDEQKWEQIMKAREYFEENSTVPPIRKFAKYIEIGRASCRERV